MRKQCSAFWKEIKESARGFAAFAGGHKGVIIVLVLALLFVYGAQIFYYSVSIDGEAALISEREILKSWLTIDRYGLLITKTLFGLDRFVPFVSNFLMVLALGFSAFFFDFCVNEWAGSSKRYRLFYYIFPVAYITAPCLAEQFYFSLQSFEVAWAMLLCIFSVYCFSRRLFRKNSILWTVPGFICMIWAFATYQSFVGVFIAVALVSFLLVYQNGGITVPKKNFWLFCGLKYIAAFVIGFAAYMLIGRLIRENFNLVSAYLDNQMVWKTEGASAALHYILGDAARIYAGFMPTFFSRLFTPVMLLCTLLLIVRGRRMKRSGFLIYLAACALLMVSPLFLSVYSGFHQPLRGQLTYVFVFAFFLAGLTTVTRKALSAVCCLIGAVVSLYHGQTVTQLFHTAYVTYNQDRDLAAAVYNRVSQVGADAGMEKYTVVFVGTHSPVFTEDALLGEMIGKSFFEWDSASYYGSTGRIIAFCDPLGYEMEIPDEAQAAYAQEQAASMPTWPATGSVQASDGIIIVKLSE